MMPLRGEFLSTYGMLCSEKALYSEQLHVIREALLIVVLVVLKKSNVMLINMEQILWLFISIKATRPVGPFLVALSDAC